jgi:hypothetical protein
LALPRVELLGLRWLAGKMLHFGPLPAVELRHWREGAEPRWKWRASDEIFDPREPEIRRSQRPAYDQALAGRDVLGTFNLTMVLIETEHLFFRLIRAANA